MLDTLYYYVVKKQISKINAKNVGHPVLLFSPVHVVLVSLLVDQLSGLFLIFFGWPKKKMSSLREFLVSL